MSDFTCRIKEYIQPFERELAFQEVGALLQNLGLKSERRSQAELTVFGNKAHINTFAERLAYWESIEGQGQSITTLQSLREATVNVVRNGIDLDVLRGALPFRDAVSLPNRRCLRYGTHGIHEYRGKFFPQLVRALINVSGTGAGGIVADPMSGSGTTLVESKLFGCESYGVDMNPLSCLLTETKAGLLEANPDELVSGYRAIREALLKPEPRSQKMAYFDNLPKDDQRYLSAWFGTEVLAALDDIMCLIQKERSLHAKGLMFVAVSNILRSVSWQKVEDLRIRKEVRFDVEIDPKKEFLEELGRSVRAVLALLYQEGRKAYPKHTIVQGDARRCAEMWPSVKGRVDTIITSPPYATALPYLDTDRLSLCYLGLLPRPEHRARDLLMIGNREVSEKMRREYLTTYQSEKSSLPEAITGLIDKIDNLNNSHDVGFRRRNLSALLFKYFSDMKRVMHSMNDALKVGGTAYIVVGNNHTTAGGERVNIETAKLLATLADQAGFVVEPSLSMEMLASRDIFRKNAMATEEILYLRKIS
ncbi:hypothetical protein [Parasphingorhabdus sp.]|uniref:hypothetical protein n=1 Tax=Parasphingorhabdus sp. TaxID=2709688 RepID=UPI003003A5BC